MMKIVDNPQLRKIFNELWEETENLRTIPNVLLIPTQVGQDSGLNDAKDRSESKLRQKFLKDCPEGFEVDHIIPRALNGADHLSNLQWLPKNLNRTKRCEIYLENYYFPHCPINVKEKIEIVSKQNIKQKLLKKLAVECDLEENLLHSVCEAVLKFGQITPAYIIRKLKVDFDVARLLCEKINSTATY